MAIIDAALISASVESPPIIVFIGIFKSGLYIPSTKTIAGFIGKFSIALFIANKEAFKILISSISVFDTDPKPKYEFSKISSDNSFLFFSVSFFESFSPGISFFKITEAAITGPARAPLPTSSVPATRFTFKVR